MGKPDKIGQLLAGSYIDPDSKKPVRVDTKSLIILPTLKGAECQAVKDLGFGRRLAVVSDVTTHEVLGQRIEGSLASLYDVTSIVLPKNPYPDGETVEKIRLATVKCDAVIAVGSGTINDVCKYGSAQDKKPYAVFATAPSMNGYTSVNAAITMHGHKMSLAAQAPTGAFFDLGVLAAAPSRMIRSGLGDSLCRTTAQADWLLSHLLFGHAYRYLPYELLADDEGPLFAQAAEDMQRYWLPWLVGMPAETSRAICSMIFGGVFERLPNLRVAFAHGGGSFPATIGRIEHGYQCRPDLVAIDNPVNPRNYLGKFYLDSLVYEPKMLEFIVDLVGANRVALGSDYPFPLGENVPGSLIRDMKLDAATKELLLSGTALEWLDLKREKFV